MEQDKSCEICKKMMREKHKHDKLYKIGFWIFLVLFLIFFALFCGSKEIFTQTEVQNEAEIIIENNGDGNRNGVNIGNRWQ